jgi:hypothetical protein
MNVNGSAIKCLTKLKSLKVYDGNSITFDDISKLTNLTKLTLGGGSGRAEKIERMFPNIHFSPNFIFR